MKILVMSNRNVRRNSPPNTRLFGNKFNSNGPDQLRLAWAKKTNKKWTVALVAKAPSVILNEYFKKLHLKKKNCVVYVHGYNADFKKSLKQAHQISKRYNVAVIVFSWPASPRPGSSQEEYIEARKLAVGSFLALDKVFSELDLCIRSCSPADREKIAQISINLLVHSLGNYVLEKFISDPIFSNETRVFDNITMNAPDVTWRTHAQWAKRMKYAKRIYATINEEDWILRESKVVNRVVRLGNVDLGSETKPKKLMSKRLAYFDLSEGRGVRNKHNHFLNTARSNEVVKSFFSRVLHGVPGLPMSGTIFDTERGAHVLERKEERFEHESP